MIVHEVMVSGLDFLIEGDSLVVVTLSSAMEVFNPRAIISSTIVISRVTYV